ncbi:nephrin-like [Tachypleus tridentatus]|uniref:nephrin-like n=1 Tax=Tachypleus tridentatus TaxID=6853 RepID=UPI003FCFF0C1
MRMAGLFLLSVIVSINQLELIFSYEVEVESLKELVQRTDLYAFPGRRTDLPCNITPEATDDNLDLVLWYTDKSPSPIYSLDARHGGLETARHWKSDDMASRIYFNISGSIARLQIDPVVKQDEGDFLCRVDFRKARSRYLELRLRIIVPPKKPVIMDETDESQLSLIGPYNEGDSLRLQCEVAGGNPRPNLTWWRESVLLDDSYEIIDNFEVRNVLQIIPLQRHDLMAALTCQAANNDVIPPSQATVTVDMNFRPLEVHIEGDKRPLSAGMAIKIKCSTAGSRPPADVTWWKNGEELKSTKSIISASGNSTVSTLTFKPSTGDDGKIVFCAATNRYIPGSTMKASWKLNVMYPPQLTLGLGRKVHHLPIDEGSDINLHEGSDVDLECIIRANPPVTHVGWKFERKDIVANHTAGITIDNTTLIIHKVQRFNRGRYLCTATNSEGRGESNRIFLRVEYSPLCKSTESTIYGAVLHRPVEVACELDSDPENVTFTWTFNNCTINDDTFYVYAEQASSTLTYTPASESMFGTLTCSGANSVGPQLKPCVFTVVLARPPDPLINCTVINLTQTIIAMECMEGYDGGIKQGFYSEVIDKARNNLKSNFTSQSPVFIADGLNPGTLYVMKMYASNILGKSEPFLVNVETLQAPPEQPRQDIGSHLQLKVILISGVSIVLVLILFVVCAIIFLKTRTPNRWKVGRRGHNAQDQKYSEPLDKETFTNEDLFKDTTCEEKCPDVIPAEMKLFETAVCEAESSSATDVHLFPETSGTFVIRASLPKQESRSDSLKTSLKNSPPLTKDFGNSQDPQGSMFSEECFDLQEDYQRRLDETFLSTPPRDFQQTEV